MANLHTFTKIVNSNISLKLCHSQMDHFIILIFCVILFQLQIGYINGYGQDCTGEKACPQNEVCQLNLNVKGICHCLSGFVESSENKTCISQSPDPPSDSSNSSGLGIGLGVILTIVLVTLLVFSVWFIHRRYGILGNVIHLFYRFRRRASSGSQAYEVADEDDVNPIV